jgi:hypothetical protein
MKNLKLAIILFIAVIGLLAVTETKAQSITVNFSMFQRELSPYGRWMYNPSYGDVWVYKDASFRPYYSNGRWEYTNYGWSWVSDYDWGWAPFHYGRWEYDPSFGWMWIPGYEWGAAWVSWSSYDDYYGWAPLGHGVNINVAFGSIPYNRWTFIPRRNICDRDINRYYIAPERNYGFRNAVVINNYYEGNGRNGRFMRGPERNEAQRYTNNRIQERNIDNRERQGYPVANNGRNRNNDWNRNNSNTDGRRNNDQQVRVDNNQRGNQNFPNNRDVATNNSNRRQMPADNNRQPNRDINNNTQQNDNRGNQNNNQQGNFPQRQQQNDNRVNQNNNQQGNFPQRQQQVERPVRQQPATEQRNMERRGDQNNRPQQGEQRTNDNNQGQRNNNGHGRRGG